MLTYNINVVNAMLDQITARAGSGALLRLYDGSRPATGASITDQRLLAQLTCASPFAPGATGGALVGNAIAPATSSLADGTVTWFRIVKSDATTHVMDGDVSTVAEGTGDFLMHNKVVYTGGTVTVASLGIYPVDPL